MPESSLARPPRRFWLIGLVALAWNLIGVMSYLMNVTAGPEALAGLSEAERNLYTDIPACIAKLRERTSVGRVAMEVLILTAARSGEIRGATWSEFDLDAPAVQ